jgi:hypothetical protein
MAPVTNIRSAVLDDQHVGDIRGALGTIALHDIGPRRGLPVRLRTLRAGVIAEGGEADWAERARWRMPPLMLLQRPVMSAGRKAGMGALRLYLLVSMVLVIVKIAQLAFGL